MDCRDIQERLSDYIEGVALSEERASIDAHLDSCKRCSEFLVDLKKTIEYARGLEEIEPPPWLTQKVMARIKAEPKPKKSLLHRMFFPLHVKLPLEAVAAVLIISLTLYIYKDIRPDAKLAQAPTEERVPMDLPDQSQTLPPSVKEQKKSLPPESVPLPAKPSELPAAGEEKYARTGKTEAARVEEKQAPGAPGPSGERDETEEARALTKDHVRQKSRAAAPGAALSLKEKTDEKVLDFIVLVKNPETAAREIERIIKEFEGKLIRAESSEGKITITAGTSAARMKEMVERLKSVGDVKVKDSDFEWMKGDVGIRISVVEDTLSLE